MTRGHHDVLYEAHQVISSTCTDLRGFSRLADDGKDGALDRFENGAISELVRGLQSHGQVVRGKGLFLIKALGQPA